MQTFFWEFCRKYKGLPFDLRPLPTRADWLDFPLREVYRSQNHQLQLDRHVVQVRSNCPSRALRETCDQASISKTATVFWRAAAKRNWTRVLGQLIAGERRQLVTQHLTNKQTNKRCHVCGECGESRRRMVSLVSVVCTARLLNRDVPNLTSICVNFLHILNLWRPAILAATPPRKAKKT